MRREQGRPSASNALRLGRALRELRDGQGWSRKELAERSSLSYPYVSQLENGDREPSLDTLAKLAGAFGLAVDELLAANPGQRPPAGPEGTRSASRRWVANPAYEGPPGPAPSPQPPGTDPGPDVANVANVADLADVVERAYRILLGLPPGQRLDAAGALLARCLADRPPQGHHPHPHR